MTRLVPGLVLALAAVLPTLAMGQSTCEAQAADKKLAGAAKTSFVKKCNEEKVNAAQAKCEDLATEKNLAGAAKTSFTKKCVTDATSPEVVCEAQATEKKLAGAARTSFTKKCVADAASAASAAAQ